MAIVSAQELLEMYKVLLKEKKQLQDDLNKSLEENVKLVDTYNKSIDKYNDLNKSYNSLIAQNHDLRNDKANLKDEVQELKDKIELKDLKQSCSEVGVAQIGDLNDYEYISDGKRLCFLNTNTGNRVYCGDAMWNELKRNMLGQ